MVKRLILVPLRCRVLLEVVMPHGFLMALIHLKGMKILQIYPLDALPVLIMLWEVML